MADICFLEIDNSDYELLDNLDIEAHQTASWKSANTSNKAFAEIVIKALKLEESSTDRTYFSISNIRVRDNLEIDSIQKYFNHFLLQSMAHIGVDNFGIEELPSVIAINLMPFFFRPADGDRIIEGFSNGIKKIKKIDKIFFVFFIRQHAMISESIELEKIVQSDFGPDNIVIIDVDGYSISIKKTTTDSALISRDNIPRSIFEKILHFKDQSSFKRALIYETNINIGHFEVGSCHIRTHYDLNDFIRRDNVFEHLYHQFSRITLNFSNINILATGLEEDALSILGNRFEAASKNDENPNNPDKKIKVVFYRGHFTLERIVAQHDDICEWLRSSDCIFLLTDVVNSGNTVTTMLEHINNIVKEHAFNSTILSFAVVKMNNSPQDIEAAVTINRPYFKSDLCPLCSIGQPFKPVRENNWKQDFRYVNSEQLTPLDFWEMIEDCDALERENFKFLHRVNTVKLVEKYKHRLSYVIKHKYDEIWGNVKPDAILTINEKMSYDFALLVSSVLDLNREFVKTIPRAVLDESEQLPDLLQFFLKKYGEEGAKILLVDDGINTGSTFRKLILSVKPYKINIIGGIVIDNRLKITQLQAIEAEMNNACICPLYTWPSSPHLN